MSYCRWMSPRWMALALVWIWTSVAGAQLSTETQKLTASDAGFLAGFGRSVSIDGDLALVGAAAAGDMGAAYVFAWDGSIWSEVQMLAASDAAVADQFGWASAIGNGYLAISAHWDDDQGGQSGSVYIFRHDGTEWVEEEKLNPVDGVAGDEFGFSLAAFEDLLVVSAPYDDDQGSNSGSTYVYRYDGTSWVEEQKLVGSAAGANDVSGWNVATDGTVIVSTTVEDLGQAGSAYVFRYNGTTWSEDTQLTASDASAGDWFGWGASVEGDVIVIGANHDHAPDDDSGSAYVFQWSGTEWLEEQKLTPLVPQPFAAFGWSTAIQGDHILVGAAGHELGDGAVYHYELDGSDWVQTDVWIASDPAGGFDDDLGFSVALDGQHVMSGAVWASAPGVGDAGAVYYYQLPVTADGFRRGDSNGDASFDIADAVLSLSALFVPGAAQPPCLDATDSNDDGAFDISDPVYSLSALFVPGSPPPAAPGTVACGVDPTVDMLDCVTYDACP